MMLFANIHKNSDSFTKFLTRTLIPRIMSTVSENALLQEDAGAAFKKYRQGMKQLAKELSKNRGRCGAFVIKTIEHKQSLLNGLPVLIRTDRDWQGSIDLATQYAEYLLALTEFGCTEELKNSKGSDEDEKTSLQFSMSPLAQTVISSKIELQLEFSRKILVNYYMLLLIDFFPEYGHEPEVTKKYYIAHIYLSQLFELPFKSWGKFQLSVKAEDAGSLSNFFQILIRHRAGVIISWLEDNPSYINLEDIPKSLIKVLSTEQLLSLTEKIAPMLGLTTPAQLYLIALTHFEKYQMNADNEDLKASLKTLRLVIIKIQDLYGSPALARIEGQLQGHIKYGYRAIIQRCQSTLRTMLDDRKFPNEFHLVADELDTKCTTLLTQVASRKSAYLS